MALYRAQQYHIRRRDSAKIWVIMFNKVLKKYTQDNLGDGDFRFGNELIKRIKTMHQWSDWWIGYWGGNKGGRPELEPYVKNWVEVGRRLDRKSLSGDTDRIFCFDNLIIDEGQDFQPEFYEFIKDLKLLGEEYGKKLSFTVFADDNQRITERNSDTGTIIKNIDPPEKYIRNLTTNYRNSKPIAELAAHFFCGTNSGIPSPPASDGPEPELSPCPNRNEEISKIVNFALNQDDLSIGIFVERDHLREEIFAEIKNQTRNTPIETQSYSSSDGELNAENLDLEKGGMITVLCAQSCKGLEFDAVFIPCLETHPVDPGKITEFKMGMYVKLSRARQHLFLSYSSSDGGKPRILEYFPVQIQDQANGEWSMPVKKDEELYSTETAALPESPKRTPLEEKLAQKAAEEPIELHIVEETTSTTNNTPKIEIYNGHDLIVLNPDRNRPLKFGRAKAIKVAGNIKMVVDFANTGEIPPRYKGEYNGHDLIVLNPEDKTPFKFGQAKAKKIAENLEYVLRSAKTGKL